MDKCTPYRTKTVNLLEAILSTLDLTARSLPSSGLWINRSDFSFLDDVCLSENLLGEIKNMANFDIIEGTSFPETNALSDDWLSGNVQLVDLTENPSFQQPEEQDCLLYPDYLSTSLSIYSSSVESIESSTNIFGAGSSVDEPLQTEKLGCDEINSSNVEATSQLDVQHPVSPLASEGEEISLEHTIDTYSLAGKKYLKMREKNNIASQRSRKLHKQKNAEMVERLKKLEIENKHLSLLATKLEIERDILQRQLLQAISKK